MLFPTAELIFQNALAHHRGGRLSEAETAYRAILSQQPHHADALHLLGVVLIETEHAEEATTFIEKAVAAQPNEPMYHANLGVAYRRLGRTDEAIASLHRATALAPNFVNALGNLGHALLDGNRPDEAMAPLRRAIELDENYAEAHAHLADAHVAGGHFSEAIVHYRKAITLRPENATIHSNFALLLLRLGHYLEGWREYEWRLTLFEPSEHFSSPRWCGEAANEKTILVHAEQGLGDTIHFLRYLPLVRERSSAARVIFQCQPELASLVRQSGNWDAEITSARHETSPFDYHIPLLSLPLLLEHFDPLPMTAPYLHVDAIRQEAWRTRLGPKSALRVGIAWAGSPSHKDNARRSVSPEVLRPVFSTPKVSFYSLQIPSAETDLVDLTGHITDFADTAAFMAKLDLIITVDTAVAHLAGALGRPVWVLLAYVADWRWDVRGESTPWYPTMRLFRQTTRDDWGGVIHQISAALSALAERH